MAVGAHTGTGKLRRNAGSIGLLFASTTSMIGSGWLFGAYHAAKLAGPYSVLSWVLGSAIIMLLVLCFAELATLFPRSGALVHMSHASHGAGMGRIWIWLLLLPYVAGAPIEAEAVITYANNYLPYFIQPHAHGLLSGIGFVTAAVLILIFTLINLLTIRWLLRINTAITWWKIFVPLLTVVGLLAAAIHTQNLSAAPGSYSITGIFVALPAAGVVFSFFGFRTAIDIAGEASRPQRDIPFAVIGSTMLVAVIYVLLQIAFLLALPASAIAHGWDQLNFANSDGPFAGLAMITGLFWLVVILYIDAYISPGGTGLIYITAGSRILTANGEVGSGPRWLTWLNGSDIPWVSVGIMFVVGCLFLLPFPAWQKMVAYVTSSTVIAYGVAPVVLLCLRQSVPEHKRPFRLRGAWIIAPLAFIASNWIVFWVGFSTNLFLFSLIFAGFAVYALYYHFVARRPAREFGWRYIAWLLPWFGGLWVLSWLGGLGVLSFGTEIWVIALWSLIMLAIAIATRLSPDATRRDSHVEYPGRCAGLGSTLQPSFVPAARSIALGQGYGSALFQCPTPMAPASVASIAQPRFGV